VRPLHIHPPHHISVPPPYKLSQMMRVFTTTHSKFYSLHCVISMPAIAIAFLPSSTASNLLLLVILFCATGLCKYSPESNYIAKEFCGSYDDGENMVVGTKSGEQMKLSYRRTVNPNRVMLTTDVTFDKEMNSLVGRLILLESICNMKMISTYMLYKISIYDGLMLSCGVQCCCSLSADGSVCPIYAEAKHAQLRCGLQPAHQEHAERRDPARHLHADVRRGAARQRPVPLWVWANYGQLRSAVQRSRSDLSGWVVVWYRSDDACCVVSGWLY
jgi:hypothetical protein